MAQAKKFVIMARCCVAVLSLLRRALSLLHRALSLLRRAEFSAARM
ncbi:hypothetical protein FORC066_1231 [Yersinia enterocolitica]|nr:hypothetical protein FORC066_1231 [Yersinia enterocolitica]